MKYHKSATLQFQKFQFFGFENNCFSFFIFAVNEEGGSVFIQIFVTISYSLIGTIVALKEYNSSALISGILV